MLLKPEIIRGLQKADISTPSPIQSAAIPIAILGTDLIAQAKSGTGKTLVFVCTVLNTINLDAFETQSIVMTPTREISVQVRDVFREIGICFPKLECHMFIGGVKMDVDIQLLKTGCQVAIGTPGRTLELIKKSHLKTMFVQIVVLDEADQLFGESFEEPITEILSSVPKKKQIIACTATLLDGVEEKISAHMQDPEKVCISQLRPALKGVKQFYKLIENNAETEQQQANSNHLILQRKVDALIEILSSTPFNQCIVFSNNKTRAHDIAEALTENGWPAEHIHGSQPQSKRLHTFEKIRNFKLRILVSSDLIARGVDIERISLVINLDIPYDA